MAQSFRSPAKIARRLKLAPLAARKLASWPRFMWNYALGLVPDEPYDFRSRARIKIGRGVDHVPIIEIFLRQDYGAVQDGAVILDLGANIGVFSIYAATTAHNVTIYAYEPMVEFYRLMQENILLNGLNGAVKCFNAAVAGDASSRDLYVEGANLFFPTLVPAGADARAVSVTCTTLSDIIDSNGLQRVDLLKMDCEGAEYEILYSTPAPYFDRIREIRMEYHSLPDQKRNFRDLAAFLNGMGYEVLVRPQPTSTISVNGNLWAHKHA